MIAKHFETLLEEFIFNNIASFANNFFPDHILRTISDYYKSQEKLE